MVVMDPPNVYAYGTSSKFMLVVAVVVNMESPRTTGGTGGGGGGGGTAGPNSSNVGDNGILELVVVEVVVGIMGY